MILIAIAARASGCAAGEMAIIIKKGTQVTATRVTRERAEGRGNRLGIAYRLEDGSMVYVPDETQ